MSKCKVCGLTVPQTGKQGRPKVFCPIHDTPEFRKADRRVYYSGWYGANREALGIKRRKYKGENVERDPVVEQLLESAWRKDRVHGILPQYLDMVRQTQASLVIAEKLLRQMIADQALDMGKFADSTVEEYCDRTLHAVTCDAGRFNASLAEWYGGEKGWTGKGTP